MNRQQVETELKRLASRSFWVGAVIGRALGLALGFAVGVGQGWTATLVVPLGGGIET